MDALMDTQDLRTRAIAVYQAAKAVREADQALDQAGQKSQQRERTMRLLVKVLGQPDAERAQISEDGRSAKIDGLRFVAHQEDYSWHLHLVDTCQDCTGSRYSYEIKDLDDVGMFLAEPASGEYHECRPLRPAKTGAEPDPAPDPKPTDAERALALVRELVDLVHMHESQEA